MSEEESSNESGERRIHVLEVIGNGIVGGVEVAVGNLIRQLPDERFSITCLCPYESAFTVSLRQMGCKVFIAPIRDDLSWQAIEMAVGVIRHHQVDLIHAHIQNAHTLAGIAGRLTHTPTVATLHSMQLGMQELSVSRLTRTHLILLCQAAYAQALAVGIAPQEMTLIPNGVDLERFTPHASGADFRARIGVPMGVPLVGFVGRLSWEKDPEKFVRVAERVHQKCPDVHFAIVGEGPRADEVAALIRQMGVADYVHLAGLWKNTPEVYPAFDIFVQTSRSEGMPLSIMEAMACARPVVAIAVGGVAELVEADTSGLLFSPGDWEGVACGLIELLTHPERLKQMGQAGRKRVEEMYDLRTSARLTGDLFQRLVNTPASETHLWQTAWTEAGSDDEEGSPPMTFSP